MTNFKILTQKPFFLEKFLEMILDDALEAEGYALDLKMPSEEWAVRSWREWFEQEAAEDGTACETSWGNPAQSGL